jgi:LacI family transcriptional regulator
MDRYLYWQFLLKDTQPVPLFLGRPGDTSALEFKRWLKKWKIDALVGLVGHEQAWLDELGLRAPEDIGLACVNRPLKSPVSGMDENHEMVGEAATDLVAQRLLHNEYGLPADPRFIFIEGRWREGTTLRVPMQTSR